MPSLCVSRHVPCIQRQILRITLLTRTAPVTCCHNLPQVWDMDIGDCILQLQLPQQVAAASQAYPGSPLAAVPSSSPVPLTALAVTADGGCCLSGDAEGWLNCWNLKTGQLVHRVRAHRGRWVGLQEL